MLLRLLLFLFLVLQYAPAHAQAGTAESDKPAVQAQSGAGENSKTASATQEKSVTDAITTEDLNDCDVLLGKKKTTEYQRYLEGVNDRADDLEYGIHFAALMHNRFVCHEDEILGEQEWALTVENEKGEVTEEVQRRVIPSIEKHPTAFTALKDAIASFTRVAERDLGSRIVLGLHYANYSDALANSQEGYFLLASAYEATCRENDDTETSKSRCKMLERDKLRYKNLVSPKERNKLDQRADVWAENYLSNAKADLYAEDEEDEEDGFTPATK